MRRSRSVKAKYGPGQISQGVPSPGPLRVESTKALIGLPSSFDRSMILLQDVVQVLDRPVAVTASRDSFLFTPEIAES